MALGSTWWTVASTSSLWILAWRLRGIGRILPLLAAPILLTALTPIATPTPLLLAAGVLLGLLALTPLLAALGPSRPSRRTAGAAGGALAVAVLLLLTPPGMALLGSDLATGAATVTLAAGALCVLPIGAPRKA